MFTKHIPIKQLLSLLLFAVLLTGIQFNVCAQSNKDLKPYYNVDKNGLWVEGYDPVAYFTENKAVKGKSEFSVVYNKATFKFSSAKNLQLFKANPTKYLPEYGGYCAYALGDYGEKVEVDPETFKVVDGKLFLFYNKYFNNTLTDWNKNEKALHTNADKNWSKLKHK
jgi:YHS domain-containing protein